MTVNLDRCEYVNLYCDGAIQGVRWLNGITQAGRVNLVDNCGPAYTGTAWLPVKLSEHVYAFMCLGNLSGNRWLNGMTQWGSVNLAPSIDYSTYSGTHWHVEEHGDFFLLHNLGTIPGTTYLNGMTQSGWVNLTGDNVTQNPGLSGTRWRACGGGSATQDPPVIAVPSVTAQPYQIPEPPALTSINQPPPYTPPSVIGTSILPCDAVNDAGLKGIAQILNSPYYTLTREQCYSLDSFRVATGVRQKDENVTIEVKSGITSGESNSFEQTTGITITAGMGFSFGGFSANLSVTISDQIKVTQSQSTTRMSETTVTRNFVLPAGENEYAVAVWAMIDRFILRRKDGSEIGHWEVSDGNRTFERTWSSD